MDLTRPWTRALAGACALTLLVSACGDDDSSDAGDETEQTDESAPTTEAGEAGGETTGSTEGGDDTEQTTETDDETEQTTEAGDESTTTEAGGAGEGDPEAVATAEAVNLTLADFAEGWTEEESDSTGPDPIDECFTETDVASTRLGEAQSNSFEATTDENSNQGQGVNMKTAVFDSPESATAVVDEVGGEAFAGCVTEYLTTEVLDGVEAQLVPVVDDPPVGEQSGGVAGAISIPATEGAPATEGLVDLHVIRTGPIVSFTFTIDTLGDTTFQDTLTGLYTVIAERQAAEAG